MKQFIRFGHVREINVYYTGYEFLFAFVPESISAARASAADSNHVTLRCAGQMAGHSISVRGAARLSEALFRGAARELSD